MHYLFPQNFVDICPNKPDINSYSEATKKKKNDCVPSPYDPLIVGKNPTGFVTRKEYVKLSEIVKKLEKTVNILAEYANYCEDCGRLCPKKFCKECYLYHKTN